jgi:hypothetical protein
MMNGFFTRVGTTEVVLEWNTPNVDATLGLFTYTVDTAGGTVVHQFTLTGYFTAADLIDAIVDECNRFTAGTNATGVTWAAVPLYGAGAQFTLTGGVSGNFWTLTAPILEKLTGLNPLTAPFEGNGGSAIDILSSGADLRPTRYLDMVCNQLTNNQAVKDGSTAKNARDVLCRWYFDYDGQNPTDKYGFPILMGYTPFYVRRIFNPPKQIQWQTNVPIGQMSFQLYDDAGIIAAINTKTNYLMTLQASEV